MSEKSTLDRKPKLKSYWETADGRQFYTKNAAENHAKTLDDRSIEEVKRTAKTPAKNAGKSTKSEEGAKKDNPSESNEDPAGKETNGDPKKGTK